MRFLANIYDPQRPDAKRWLDLITGQTYEEVWAKREDWLRNKLIGRPQATAAYSIEELEAQGIVGVYAIDPVASQP